MKCGFNPHASILHGRIVQYIHTYIHMTHACLPLKTPLISNSINPCLLAILDDDDEKGFPNIHQHTNIIADTILGASFFLSL